MLSPFLFIVALARLPSTIPKGRRFPVHCSVYADDYALWTSGPRRHLSAVRTCLQEALNASVGHLASVGLSVSPAKTKALVSHSRHQHTHHEEGYIAQERKVTNKNTLSADNSTPGRATLEALDINPPTQVASKRSLPPEWQQDIITRPLPRNMHPVHYENSRPARAKAYDKYSGRAGAFFEDAAAPPHNRSTATVVHREQVVDCISATRIDITAMEEAEPPLSSNDSQVAYRNFARGQVGRLTQSILQQAAANHQEGQWKQLLWVPGHVGVRGNEIAHTSALELYTGTPPIPPQHNFTLTRTIPSPPFIF
ncbi:hypothetical protein HPB49_024166 [Dermacentor silvarum]|uniref:Uncharacterized protein n=1 Tax=Dermacentor silvarum TaxID=543639 RepID=A0ACB8D8U4_DERSI|nr:hypothetical protein HPB49_024166 [Dermacentor silvarum]